MSRIALCLILAGLTSACQASLTSHMPEDLDLGPTWSEYEPPWAGTTPDMGTDPGLPDAGLPDTVLEGPNEIPSDPLADVPAAAPDEQPLERAPTTITPEPSAPGSLPLDPLFDDPAPPLISPPGVDSSDRPAPPRWDPGRDRKVDREVWESGRRGPASPSAPLPAVPPGPRSADDLLDPCRPPGAPLREVPDLPPGPELPAVSAPEVPAPDVPGPAMPALGGPPAVPAQPGVDPSLGPLDDGMSKPTLPEVPTVPAQPELPAQVPPTRVPAVSEGPAAASDDLGAPPGGLPDSPLGPVPNTPVEPSAPSQPAIPDLPSPGPLQPAPAVPAPAVPAPAVPAPAVPAPAVPAPAVPAPGGLDDDPFGPAPGGPPAAGPKPGSQPGADLEDDVWSGSGNAVPTLPSVPTLPAAPTDPMSAGAAAPDADDPFAAGGARQAPAGRRWSSDDPEERAQEQATRLFDDPGNAALQGYPSEILMLAEAWVATREGPRPLAVVLYDDSLRTSDLLAAEVLPVLAAHQKHIDIVVIDRRPGAEINEYERLVVRKLIGDDEDVPVLVVQDADRKTLLARFGPFPGEELDRVLRTGLPAGAAPQPTAATPGALPAVRAAPAQPGAGPSDDLPPTGLPDNPFGPIPTGPTPAGPTPSGPTVRDPVPGLPPGPGEPSAPDAPADPAEPADPGARETPVFSVPKAEGARRHAAQLRENPDSAELGGYPTRLLSRAQPEIALSPGHRPVVIVFYDDTSRASNLQAADILPVLVDSGQRADIIVIDVAKGATRTDAESRVVKPYYPGSVPAVVVLSASRAPVKLWFQRTSSRALRAAIDQAEGVK